MQKKYYENEASKWSLENKNVVVGPFNKQNNCKFFNFLFTDIKDTNKKTMLDFGCGPGRCLVKYSKQFKQIDGIDISENNIKNARNYLKSQDCDPKKHKLYVCNGIDLTNIKPNKYDVVMSVLTLQTICVYDIRLNYLKEFYRVLKPNGYITIQMGYGTPNKKLRLLDHPNPKMRRAVNYYENFYDAIGTNGRCDVLVESIEQIQKDLELIGFTNFKHYITPSGPNQRNCHPNWIFFNAQKT
jgi:ubiquinone/menaquinone biosynthesis C-methylase UbiE